MPVQEGYKVVIPKEVPPEKKREPLFL